MASSALTGEARTCTKCGETYPLACFYLKRADGTARRTRCKWCSAIDSQISLTDPDRWNRKLAADRARRRKNVYPAERAMIRQRRADLRIMVDRLLADGIRIGELARRTGINRNTLHNWHVGSVMYPRRSDADPLYRYYRRHAWRNAPED